jgi:hypothetical protein
VSVWVVFPSAAPVEQARRYVAAWRERGYRVMVMVDDDRKLGADFGVWSAGYGGYARAVNKLAHAVLGDLGEAWNGGGGDWVVAAADDVWPGDHDPEQVARECEEHFGGTLGVMQPTGDPWRDHGIEKYAGSPWLGREWCERAYGGRGPLNPDYYHFYCDTELQQVAQRCGVFWQRRDLTHWHYQWKRPPDGVEGVTNEEGYKIGMQRPEHGKPARARWQRDHDLFHARQEAGFPGSELA